MRVTITTIVALALQGCCLSPGFVAAQRSYHDAIKGEYRTYVEHDAGMREEDKQSRYDMLDAQEAVLREAEGE